MLILTHRISESVIIDGDIEVKILRANGNQIKIGIDAPKDVDIARE